MKLKTPKFKKYIKEHGTTKARISEDFESICLEAKKGEKFHFYLEDNTLMCDEIIMVWSDYKGTFEIEECCDKCINHLTSIYTNTRVVVCSNFDCDCHKNPKQEEVYFNFMKRFKRLEGGGHAFDLKGEFITAKIEEGVNLYRYDKYANLVPGKEADRNDKSIGKCYLCGGLVETDGNSTGVSEKELREGDRKIDSVQHKVCPPGKNPKQEEKYQRHTPNSEQVAEFAENHTPKNPKQSLGELVRDLTQVNKGNVKSYVKRRLEEFLSDYITKEEAREGAIKYFTALKKEAEIAKEPVFLYEMNNQLDLLNKIK
ncbi:MAG: hypothetical protein GY793_07515 [Proteobacteria bacterium]|nr:hypothetical protein [Pseudomonadota bacterium]